MSAKISPEFLVDEKDMPATDNAIAELFEGIDEIYFMENGFRAISNELEKLSEVNMEIDELEREKFKLKRQMQVVTKKITSSIVKNSLEFNRNVESYETIRREAEEMLEVIRELRKSMGESRRKCKASSMVLTREFKRGLAARLKEELEIIRTLHKAECKMRELIQGSNIFAFVEFSVEILFAMKQYMKYSSVKELFAKLLRLMELEEAKIDLLLGSQVAYFIPEQYAYLSSAYKLVGHEEKMSKKLLADFKSAFRDSAHIALVELIKDFSNNYSDVANLEERKFEELCKLVDQKYFLRALREIGLKLAMRLANYHSILRFHMEEDKANCDEGGGGGGGFGGKVDDDGCGNQLIDLPLMIIERGIVQKSLLDNLHQIFEAAAIYYNLLLSNFDLIHLKFDQFLKIIELSEKFRKFGLRHFANSGAEIYQTLQNQSNAFFKQYHSERIEELKMFLENETFTLCPVSIQFTIFDLSEFYFLKSSEAFENDGGQIMEEICFESDSANYRRLNFIMMESNSRIIDLFPALEQLEESPTHSLKFQNSISCDTPEENDGQLDMLFPTKSMPNLCNTALNLLRIIGRYIKMSKILQCTSEQAIDAILQLYNYFIYTLYQIFCLDFPLQRQQTTFGTTFSSLRLKQLMDSINKTYFNKQTNDMEKETLEELTKNDLMFLPNVRLNLEDATNLFLLPERIIGIESGIFLSKQMELLRPVLEALIPPKKRNLKLDAFYKSLSTTPDLLEASIGCVAAKILPYNLLLKQIQSIDWNIGEIPSQHSAYVDNILKEFEEFKQKFVKLYAYINVSEQLHQTIWSMLSLCTMRILVQGYSEAKKCTTEGRALQLLDIEQLCNSLEEMAQIRPLPHRFYVENYIKAFFLPQDELSQWIVHHTEYTLSQTSALLNSVNNPSNNASGSKKTATMSRIMMNLLDASGIGDSGNSLFHQ